VAAKDNQQSDAVRPMGAPAHVDLGGVPGKIMRISGRTRWMLVAITAALLAAFAYGGYERTRKIETAARQTGVPSGIVPATSAAAEILKKVPDATPPIDAGQLHPPGLLNTLPSTLPPNPSSTCGQDKQTGQQYRFDPETGRPCDLPPLPPLPPPPQERVVVVRPAAAPASVPGASARPTEEQQLAAAIAAPTSIRSAGNQSAQNSQAHLGSLVLTPTAAVAPPSTNNAVAPGTQDDYERQNAQTRKEEFLLQARERQSTDYLGATRQAPLSRYEVKAGWEIPAILEQALNSDLPGELKALVASNVYDTATGMYLLIPQGSRLLGKYDSRISYGQDAVQVAWNRIIYPDASSVDLDGMVGLDAQGSAGLHDKVDRHYRRLIGFSALTSLMTAAYAISQQRNQSVLVAPSPSQTASSAVGEELSRTGSDLTRRNLNVQPTIKVPAGYKFVVRVNKDILFNEPYRPEPADPQLLPRRQGLTERATN